MTEIFDARIKTPFALIASGPTLSGKTTFVENLLRNRNDLIDNEFDYMVWFYGQTTAFVNELRNQSIGIQTTVVEGLPSSFDDYLISGKRGLFVFDDLLRFVGDSHLITDLFCNKVQHCNVSVILLLQNIFYHGRERTTLLRCAHYLVIFKNPLDGSIPLYLAQKIMPLKKKVFIDIFEHATQKPFGYLFIDGRQTTPPSARFRSDVFDFGVQTVFVLNGDLEK